MTTKKIEDGIRAYLDSLGRSDKPVVDREAVRALKAQIRGEKDVINKAKLLSELEREEAGRVVDRSGDEAVFVAEGRAWAESEGITVSALQALGVPDDMLKQAGFEVPAGGAVKLRSGGAGGGSGTRAPALPLDVVAAEARKLGSGWKVADLAQKLGREPMTVRNYVLKLIEQGVVKDLGDDPKHDGRGRANFCCPTRVKMRTNEKASDPWRERSLDRCLGLSRTDVLIQARVLTWVFWSG